jgi:hypothetical protein
MGKTFLTYSAVLIGAYLALSYATQAGQLLNSLRSDYVGGVKVLQGR